MKRITALYLGALLIGQTPALLLANHDGMGPGDHPKMGAEMVEKRTERLTKKLDLTVKQQEDVKVILKAEQDQLKPVHEQIKTIHDGTMEKIKAQLTDEQKKKFDEWKERKEEKMEKRYKKEMKK